jgi:hypothetical protein
MLYVRARVSWPDNLGGRAVCAGGPDRHAMCRRSGSNKYCSYADGDVQYFNMTRESSEQLWMIVSRWKSACKTESLLGLAGQNVLQTSCSPTSH